MYELTVLTCWRGLNRPVFGARADRSNPMTPRSLVNSSSGSLGLKGMFAI
jgi:hypothetical protein